MRIAFLFFISITVSFGQKKVATVSMESMPVFAAVDRPGDLYVVLANNRLMKVDKSGLTINVVTLPSIPTILDPKDGTRVFAYYHDTQSIESLTPDLSESTFTSLHPEFAVSASLVCPSKNELWILDAADFSLKKTRSNGSAIAYESAFRKTESKYMREYLNFLFVLDSGIHILNNLGKEINKLDVNVPYFSFLGEEIYYPQGNSLVLVDLYTSEKRTLGLPHPARFAFLTDDRLILVDDKNIDFFEFTP
jgi:hypothetical protein